MYVCIYIYIYIMPLPLFSISLTFFLFVYIWFYILLFLSVLSIYPSFHPSIYPFIHPSIYLSFLLPLFLSFTGSLILWLSKQPFYFLSFKFDQLIFLRYKYNDELGFETLRNSQFSDSYLISCVPLLQPCRHPDRTSRLPRLEKVLSEWLSINTETSFLRWHKWRIIPAQFWMTESSSVRSGNVGGQDTCPLFPPSVQGMQSLKHEEGGVKPLPVEKQMQSPSRFQYPQSVGKQTIVICHGKRYTWLCFLQRRRLSHTAMQRSTSYALSQGIEQLFRNLCRRCCFQIRQLRRLAQGLMWDEM